MDRRDGDARDGGARGGSARRGREAARDEVSDGHREGARRVAKADGEQSTADRPNGHGGAALDRAADRMRDGLRAAAERREVARENAAAARKKARDAVAELLKRVRDRASESRQARDGDDVADHLRTSVKKQRADARTAARARVRDAAARADGMTRDEARRVVAGSRGPVRTPHVDRDPDDVAGERVVSTAKQTRGDADRLRSKIQKQVRVAVRKAVRESVRREQGARGDVRARRDATRIAADVIERVTGLSDPGPRRP